MPSPGLSRDGHHLPYREWTSSGPARAHSPPVVPSPLHSSSLLDSLNTHSPPQISVDVDWCVRRRASDGRHSAPKSRHNITTQHHHGLYPHAGQW